MLSTTNISLSAAQIDQYSRTIDGSYLIIKRLDCSKTDRNLVFLVEEIESKKLNVLKYYNPDEIKSFYKEAQTNMDLIQSPKVQRAIKIVTERDDMNPF